MLACKKGTRRVRNLKNPQLAPLQAPQLSFHMRFPCQVPATVQLDAG
jgi:hypothetical protein